MSSETRFDPSSRSRLTPRDVGRFPGDTLFARVARVVCEADCLPRKELYESWEVARRVRRRMRAGRVVELAAGHGLVAHLLLLLDASSPDAILVDARIPASAATLAAALRARWPALEGRVRTVQDDVDAVPIASDDLVVSVHGCGALSDRVLRAAVGARARLALLPCCHDAQTCDTGGLEGFMDASLAIDATRVATLRARGYGVHTSTIPHDITPKNRLILAWPEERRDDPRAASVHTG